jgi:hypothetical protein
VTVFLQGIEQDSMATKGFSFTRGASITIGTP